MSEAPFKVCPEGELPTEDILPDRNELTGCGAKVPTGVKMCPLCGFTFEKPGEEPVEQVVLTEIDLLDSSPFRWVDLFGSGRVMIASGFDAWAGVFSPDDGENWYALGKPSDSRIVSKIMFGDRIRALAAADDFLREKESSDASKKSKRWLRDPATEKQMQLLTRAGYQVDQLGFGFTKYTAMAHLNFQWNRKQIEHALGVA